MQGWVKKLRSVFAPHIVLLLLAALMLLGGGMVRCSEKTEVSQTELEKKIGFALSSMEGAGKVTVVLRTKHIAQSRSGKEQIENDVIVGAVAVAQGADHPLVLLELQNALCTLLGLPPSAVSVVAGGK